MQQQIIDAEVVQQPSINKVPNQKDERVHNVLENVLKEVRGEDNMDTKFTYTRKDGTQRTFDQEDINAILYCGNQQVEEKLNQIQQMQESEEQQEEGLFTIKNGIKYGGAAVGGGIVGYIIGSSNGKASVDSNDIDSLSNAFDKLF